MQELCKHPPTPHTYQKKKFVVLTKESVDNFVYYFIRLGQIERFCSHFKSKFNKQKYINND